MAQDALRNNPYSSNRAGHAHRERYQKNGRTPGPEFATTEKRSGRGAGDRDPVSKRGFLDDISGHLEQHPRAFLSRSFSGRIGVRFRRRRKRRRTGATSTTVHGALRNIEAASKANYALAAQRTRL